MAGIAPGVSLSWKNKEKIKKDLPRTGRKKGSKKL